jgi:V/A-type H+-transporting ATPase subunit I
VEARAFAGRSEAVVFLAGWIPDDRVAAVRAAVQGASGGRCFVGVDDPADIDSVRSGTEPVPILFRNPALVRPFEQLLAAYGAPAWREIDPTPLVAVGFWIMFGLMFGDVGHGAVLAGLGLFVFRRLVRYRDYGVILMECGVASALFGFAYGSVFGFEHALPALWFRPMEDVPRLLRVGAAFGVVVLGLSFALGVLNAALRRDVAAALFGAHGLLGALAYWIAAALGLRWLATGELGVSLGLATALVALPLSALFARGVWAASRGGSGSGGGALAALLGSAVELVDFVVRSIANTVSFVRIAAFAVSHAGLLLAVFALAETVAGARGGWIWSALVIVAGNLLILALEGLIVSIQGVRLVYYEFFSRFHAGAGLPYRPLRLRPGGLEEAT